MVSTPINPISTFVINLKSRVDRKNHILSQFSGRSEFDVTIVEAEIHEIGAVGLWNTITKIVANALKASVDYVLICEDDHLFTNDYSAEILGKCIVEAKFLNAEILAGGVSSVESVIPVSKNLLWVERFTGLQFTIIFRDFFDKILLADFLPDEAADYKFSELSDRKFLIFPFVSIQKEFGYSDATPTRTRFSDDVTLFFKSSSQSIIRLLEGCEYYRSMGYDRSSGGGVDDYDFIIKTYIISNSIEERQIQQVMRRFEMKKEFDLDFIQVDSEKADDIWNGIKKAVQRALDEDEDVVLICDSNHEFSQHYVSQVFFENVESAYLRGADILLGNASGDFDFAIVAGLDTFWINKFTDSHFMIVYKKFFRKILDASFVDVACYKGLLSSLTSAKMTIHPFISQDAFYLDEPDEVGDENETDVGVERQKIFLKADNRLRAVRMAFDIYADRYLC